MRCWPSADLALGLICDGIHVNPKLVKLLAQLPADRVFLETDANKHAGGKETEFEFYPGYWVKSAPGKAVRRPQRRALRLLADARRGDAQLSCAMSAPIWPARPMPRASCRRGCSARERESAASSPESSPTSWCSTRGRLEVEATYVRRRTLSTGAPHERRRPKSRCATTRTATSISISTARPTPRSTSSSAATASRRCTRSSRRSAGTCTSDIREPSDRRRRLRTGQALAAFLRAARTPTSTSRSATTKSC